VHDRLEQLLLAAEILGAFRVVPDVGRLERAIDFDQAGALDIEVKDTPGVRSPAGTGRR
jgi:hypothetical protein